MSMQASISPVMTGEAAQKMIEKIIRDNAAGISDALLVSPSAEDDAGDDEA